MWPEYWLNPDHAIRVVVKTTPLTLGHAADKSRFEVVSHVIEIVEFIPQSSWQPYLTDAVQNRLY